MSSRDSYLKRLYGIDEAQYEAMLAAQGGVCAICGKKPGKVRLAVDHDHATGKVLGLIHARENEAKGKFEWSNAVLLRAAAYFIKTVEGRLNNV